MKLIANTQTDHQNAKFAFRLTDIVTYRGAFAAKTASITLTRLDTTTFATIINLQGQNASIKLVVHRQTDRQTDIVTYRAAIAAKNVSNNNSLISDMKMTLC